MPEIVIHIMMQYQPANSGALVHYKLPAMNFPHKVHFLNFKRPPRPGILNKNGILTAVGNMSGWVWYSLSGPDNTQVRRVGEGVSFKPIKKGTYCVIGKLGVGYAVSAPVAY